MLVIDPAQRISALDGLMHDFCIVNKKNYIDQNKNNTFVLCADDFLSQYSMDKRSNVNSQTVIMSNGSFLFPERLSFITRNDSCFEECTKQKTTKNSLSNNDLSSKGLLSKQGTSALHTLNADSNHENSTENGVNSKSGAQKKSKFAS
jgi:hypothetical protein